MSLIFFFTTIIKFTYSQMDLSLQQAFQTIDQACYAQNSISQECKNPTLSYITLNSKVQNITRQNSIYCFYMWPGSLIQMDLTFTGTWQNQLLMIQAEKFQYNYSYTSPQVYPIKSGFCDEQQAEIKTINFTSPDYSHALNFNSFIAGNGTVSIGNVIISRLSCYPRCRECTGQEYNQCKSCYYGNPVNSICPPCPSGQYYVRYQGCQQMCQFQSYKTYDGFCNQFASNIFSFYSSQNKQINQIYDYNYTDINQGEINITVNYIQGIFKYNSGINIYFHSQYQTQDTFLNDIFLAIYLFEEMPLGCSLQFKLNNTYIGSIFRTKEGYQYHKIKLYSIFNQTKCNYFYQGFCQYLQLILQADIQKYDFIFTAIGSYNDPTAGWGLNNFVVSSGLCPHSCKKCEVSFKCKECQQGYYLYRDGTCTSCSEYYQRKQGIYCKDADEETQFSKFFIRQEQYSNPIYYQSFQLIKQSGINFLKGNGIYYQFNFTNQRSGNFIFGGQFIWAQALFQQIYNISEPHHGITIGFTILFGPSFPENGLFIYTIDDYQPVEISKNNSQVRISERVNHTQSQLKVQFECFGPDNEPIYAYCGFYQYSIVIHQCYPSCQSCTGESELDCVVWNTEPKYLLKQEDCQSNEYYDQNEWQCFQCPSTCLTCISEFDCLTCKQSYGLQKLRCVCKINEYEEQNECRECPKECNQCLNPSHCFECLAIHNRLLSNAKCICYDGYYSVDNDPVCLKCNRFCKTCYGPSQQECILCNNILNIQQIDSTCQCPLGTYYDFHQRSCLNCHKLCETCYAVTSCLSCNPEQNRILKGLGCVCKPGYYEIDLICQLCPINEDLELQQCYKQCNGNNLIWHSQQCSYCDPGFILVEQECQPQCGDLQVKGYEQCDDGNNQLDDLCFNCQYLCPIHCTTCDQNTQLPCPDICGDGIVTGNEECDDGNNFQNNGCYNCKYQCLDSCYKCIKGECYECASDGWQLNPLIKPWVCKEICGDSKIVGREQCDFGQNNLEKYEELGCKDCKFYCRTGCSKCDYNKGLCLSCELKGFKPEKFYCRNICGDGILAQDPLNFFSEECDYGNNNDFYHGCTYNCQFQCQDICGDCQNRQCQSCTFGYYLFAQTTICEDQTKNECTTPLKSIEYKYCRPKCQSSCLTCSNSKKLGIACLQCKEGYLKVGKLCHTICGDGIVTEDEQCDDGNMLFNDGCHQCLFTCDYACSNCIQGICYECFDGYYLYMNKCIKEGDKLQLQEDQTKMISFVLKKFRITRNLQIKSPNQFNIYVSIPDLQQEFNNQGQFYYLVDAKYSLIKLNIEIVCQQDKSIQSLFNNQRRGFYKKQMSFSHKCNSFNGETLQQYEVQLQRIIEISQQLLLSIQIEENSCLISSVVQNAYQMLVEIQLVDE